MGLNRDSDPPAKSVHGNAEYPCIVNFDLALSQSEWAC